MQVDFDTYARLGVELANAPLADLDDLRALLTKRPWWTDRVTGEDLAVLRSTGRALHEVFRLGAAGRDADTVAALNALLEAHPVQPQISGHDASDWHIHMTRSGSPVAVEYTAAAAWGIAVTLTRWGTARFGICADATCGNAYLDTSTNRSRRYCTDRCATRAHVAAHRARKRATAG